MINGTYSNELIARITETTKRLKQMGNNDIVSTPKERQDLFQKQFTFSGIGHKQSISKVYKPFFGQECNITDTTGGDSFLDTKIGVDYIVSIKHKKLVADVDFWIQERFRKAKDQHYQSVTLIECNQHSGHLSEVYKTKAQYLVYGYLEDNKENTLSQCVVVDLPGALQAILTDKINFEVRTNSYTNQRFITIQIEDLRAHGLVVFEYQK